MIVSLVIWVALLYTGRNGGNDLDNIERLHDENILLQHERDSLLIEIECFSDVVNEQDSVIDKNIRDRNVAVNQLRKARNEIKRLTDIAGYNDDESLRFYTDSVLPGLIERFGDIITGDSI